MRSPNLGHIFQYFTRIENKLSSGWVLVNLLRLGYFLAGRLTGEIMPRIAKELSALEVKRLSYAGTGQNQTVAVGGVSGLLMQLTPNGGRSWVLRTLVGGKRKEFGLGSFPEISLTAARDRARELKEKIRSGVDPLEERKAQRSALLAEQMRGLTFEAAVDRYLEAKLDEFSNPKHRQQWRNTLKTYAIPALVHIPESFEMAIVKWLEKLQWLGFTGADALFPDTKYLKPRFALSGRKMGPVPVMSTTHAVTDAFSIASRNSGTKYTPHSAKHTIGAERDIRALTHEERKAWSFNMGHESKLTTERHYGTLTDDRRFEVLESIGRKKTIDPSRLSESEKAKMFDTIWETLNSR